MDEKPIDVQGDIGVQTPMEQAEVESPTPVIEQKPKINKFVILGVVLGVLIFAGVVFVAYKIGQRQIQLQPSPSPEIVVSPSPDPTADWQTYTNEEYGYSIKYPTDFEFSESKLVEDFIVDFTWIKEGIGHKPGVSIRVINSVGPAWTSIRDYFEKEFLNKEIGSTIEGEKGKVTVLEKAKIEDAEAIKQIEESVPGAPTEQYYAVVLYIYKNNRVYKLSLYATNKNTVLEEEDTFNLMLSTFKFLEGDPTVNWETYQNEKYRFEMKYPKDWKLSAHEPESSTYLLTLSLEKTDASQARVVLPGDDTAEAMYRISLYVSDNPQNISAKEKYLSEFSLESRAKAEEQLEEVEVGGEKGIKYSEGAAPASGPETVIFVSSNKKFYGIFYGAMAHSETHEKFIDIFDLILSTFHFLE